MRTRLRAAYSEEQLKAIYRVPHDHAQWESHVGRVAHTIAIGKRLPTVTHIGDLSCGNAAIAKGLCVLRATELVLGDFAQGFQHHGPIESTIDQIEPVNLFICSETIEHLDDPDGILKKIRTKTDYLVLSTPLITDGIDENPEHYWTFDKEEVHAMLTNAGFTPLYYDEFDGGWYVWQIWACK